jgi:hypothetical protein
LKDTYDLYAGKCSTGVTRKMTYKITSVPASNRRRIQARCKDSAKVIVKFIRKGLHFQQTESRLSPE